MSRNKEIALFREISELICEQISKEKRNIRQYEEQVFDCVASLKVVADCFAWAYQFFPILCQELMVNLLPDKRYPIVSILMPRFLQTKQLTPSISYFLSFDDMLQKDSMCRMTHFKDDAENRFNFSIKEIM